MSTENFTAFPLMANLLELDLRNCHMMGLKSSYFTNLPNLMRLFVSHNFFTTIRADDVFSLRNLQHLDISYNEIPKKYAKQKDGLLFEENLFKNLPRLMFLDLSHTKLSSNSSRALRHIGSSMAQLSLCYTGIKSLDIDTFSNTRIKVIDLSGNTELYANLTPHHFQYLDETLEIFVFRNGDIRGKDLFTYLKKLRMLDLRHNRIDSLAPFDFALLKNLEIIDLAYNEIKNW